MVQVERTFKRCYKMLYTYYDIELQQKFENELYFKDLTQIRDWFSDTIFYNGIIEADLHGNRSDMSIKIKEVFLTEKKYFVLFKD